MIKYETKKQKEKKVAVTAIVPEKYRDLLIALGENNLSRGMNILIKSNEKFIAKHIEESKKQLNKGIKK
jgi:hypothetical protein